MQKTSNDAESSIGADFRWIGEHGIGRFAAEVLRRIKCKAIAGRTPILHPADPIVQGLAVRKSACKVYFSPGFNPPISAHVPVIFTLHDLMHLRSERSTKKALFYKYVVKPAAKKSPAVLTVSEYSKRQIIEWADLPDKQVLVVGNGVSEGFAPEGEIANPGFPYLLYVGNFRPHKNLTRLLTAFSISKVAKQLYLCLVGNQDTEISSLAHSLNISNQVKFLGRKTNGELAALYRGAQAVLCPSIDEGFGLPVLEAMACGTPSLVGTGHAAEEVAGGSAVTCDPWSVDSIAAAMEKLVASSDLRADLARKGLERAKHFNWDQVAHRIESAIDSIN